MFDMRLLAYAENLNDLYSGKAAEKFSYELSTRHKWLGLSKLSSWDMTERHDEMTTWMFEDNLQIKISSPAICNGHRKLFCLRSIYKEKEDRSFGLGKVRKCLKELLEALERTATPLFLCVKTFEMAGGIEKYDNCPKRQRALCNVMLSLGFERLDTLNFIRLAEGYDEPFKERNKGNIPIPFFIFIPESCTRDDRDFYEKYLVEAGE